MDGIETFRDAIEHRRRVWLFCATCGGSRIYDPRKMALKVGIDERLREMQFHSTCPRCKARSGLFLIPETMPRLYDR